MKGLRSFVVLLAVAAALGGFLWYDSTRAPDAGSKQEKVFAGVDADKIEQVTVTSAAGEKTTVQKQGSAWQVTAPAAAPADEAELSGITSNLASLEVQRVVDEQASDFKEYGLEPANVTVAFKAAGKEQTLLLGNKTPTGGDMYARLPSSPRVFLVSSFLETTFNKSTFDLRDKTVLKLDREKVERVEVQTADRTVTFVKQGADWRITSPIEARADFGAVEGIIGRLNTSPMKSIEAGDASDPKLLARFGLDKPAATVRVTSGSSQAGLAIGKSAAEGTVYARDLSRPLIFTVESGLADDLKKAPDEFRIKDLFDARAFNTTRIEVARQGRTLAFEKDKDVWKQVTPAARAADAAKVDALLSALTGTRANGFETKLAAAGLDAPEIVATLKFEDGKKEEKVTFARKGADAFARREGDTAAAKIDASTLDGIIKAFDALK
ncbi:MAG TPA: DUF4340 domain-containing protein [Vicinamibacterales bacterium]|nr:DUF4340 domain-containing protein [Vicinamibacterales bacterium]